MAGRLISTVGLLLVTTLCINCVAVMCKRRGKVESRKEEEKIKEGKGKDRKEERERNEDLHAGCRFGQRLRVVLLYLLPGPPFFLLLPSYHCSHNTQGLAWWYAFLFFFSSPYASPLPVSFLLPLMKVPVCCRKSPPPLLFVPPFSCVLWWQRKVRDVDHDDWQVLTPPPPPKISYSSLYLLSLSFIWLFLLLPFCPFLPPYALQ